MLGLISDIYCTREDDPRFGNWQDFQEESKQKDLFGRGNAKKTCSDGKHSDEFPRHAKARDSAVNCQGTDTDNTLVEHFQPPGFLDLSIVQLFLLNVLLK